MLYKKFKPSAFLEPLVETFFIWECAFAQNIPLIVESPPNGYASIVFNYGDAYSIVNEKYDNQKVPGSFLSGQSTKCYQLHLAGRIAMIGVVFKPAALNTIFGLPMYEFSDERVDLRDVLGDGVAFMHEQIVDARTADERVRILEEFLSRKVTQSKRTFDRTDFIANSILSAHGVLPMQELMKELFVCPRQFQRKFLEKVGVSAKYYARISRMSNVCAILAQNKWFVQDWHHIIYQHGYYDQSHFIKEFTEFMGKAPSAYIRSNVELGNYLDR
jgi:AraC-like DNA-binding protein